MFWHVSVLLSVHGGGGGGVYPYPIMLCNITQNAMGQTSGGIPISHNALQHYPGFHGADNWEGTLPGPAGVGWGGGTLPGCGGGTLPGGYPAQGVPSPGGGTQLGQQKEYSLHGGRYASCVHAGGLSCCYLLHCLPPVWYRRTLHWGLLNPSVASTLTVDHCASPGKIYKSTKRS